MPLPKFNLSRLRLRSKLLLLAALPLLGLLGTSGLLVNNAQQARAQAIVEQEEIDRIGLSANLVNRLVLERDRYLRSTTIQFFLDEAQAETDRAFDAYEAVLSGDIARLTEVEAMRSELIAIRGKFGAAEEMLEMQEQAEVLGRGEAFELFQRTDALVEQAIAQTTPVPGALESNQANVNARSVLLLADYSAFLRSELLSYVEIGEAPNQLAADNARARAFKLTGQVEEAENQILRAGSSEFQAEFRDLIEGGTYGLITRLRDRIAADIRDASLAPNANFLPSYDPVFNSIQDLQTGLVESVSLDADENAAAATVTLLATAASTLVFVGIMALLVVSLFRSIRSPLLSLTDQSRQIAKHQLPNTVAQIRELGGEAQIEMPDPIIAESDDEIGELVDAFNQLHTTAIELAAEQAESRRTVSEMFVNLGRRNQKILMRLLSSLEKLERNERDPEVLRELFKVDHLATRMRRNAESLLVLAGAKTSRSFSQSIPVGDVVRSALSEVEDYERVTIDDESFAMLSGKAVADIGHLLAELIENALMFSPPSSPVDVTARRTADGLVLTVSDRGIGLSTEELEANNERIKLAAGRTETPSRFLGLYVVGRLASRHGVRVELVNGVPNGLVARIQMPPAIYDVMEGAPELVEETPAPTPTPTPAPIAIATPEISITPEPNVPAMPSYSAPAQDVSPLTSTTIPADVSSISADAFLADADDLAAKESPLPPAPSHRRTADLPQREATPAAEHYSPPAPVAHPAQAPQPVQQAQPPQPYAQPMQPRPAAQPPAPQQPAPTGQPFQLPQRQRSSTASVGQQSPAAADPANHRMPNSDRNLAGFQRSVAASPPPTQAPAHAQPPAPVQAEQQRRSTDPVPPQAAAPAQAPAQVQTPAPGGFSVQRRVPGASSLTKVAPEAAPAAAPAPESSADSGARFGSKLAGFQQGVKRADTAQHTASPAANTTPDSNGEQS